MGQINIGVVIVTYNRLDKLRETLRCFDCQTKSPKYMVIVDNASSDGTSQYLQEWKSIPSTYAKHVLTNESNLGGSGGFYTGLKRSLELNADWIWVSDDDAFPEKNALEETGRRIQLISQKQMNVAAICSCVINNGNFDLDHRKNYKIRALNIREDLIPSSAYSQDSFELSCFSYVGAIINKNKMRQVGLTEKDYFLWYDDTEHSMRLSKVGKIICYPSIRVHHDVGYVKGDFSWKTYYGFRNMTDMYKKHFPKITYYFFISKMFIKTHLLDLLGQKKEENKAIRTGISDCIKKQFGVHKIYRPGWKPTNG